MENCEYCGTKLKETDHGRKFCPNHGIMEEDEETASGGTPNYIG